MANATRVAADGALEIIHGYALAFLAGVLVDRGDLEGARTTLSGLCADLEHRPLDDARFLLHARGRAALASGANAQAAGDLLACGRRELELGNRNPAWIPWRSDAATALAALGQREEARRLASEEVELAQAFGVQRVIGVALRGLALVEPNARRIELLQDAVAVLARSSAPLDQARALVSLGGALRASRRRADARRALREGLDLAARCGAGALVAEARQELIADGARPRRDALRGRDALTASEHRTARMAADGLSNREIAQALFVTTKTVETHLGSAYTKLAIRSRAQLPDALAHASAVALPPAA